MAFLDKLEKSNTPYNRIIENNDFNYGEEIKKEYLKFGIYMKEDILNILDRL